MERENLPGLNTPVRELARPDAVRLLQTETVAEALSRLRHETIGERIVYFYVVDNAGRLTGVVPTRRLILSDPSNIVRDLMIQPVVSVHEAAPFSEALRAISERRLLALPVVDGQGLLTGVLDVTAFTQTLLDLERRAAADEVFQLAGIHIEQAQTRSLGWALRSRFPWLLLNLCSGIGAALISQAFDELLRVVVVLAFFVPLILTLAESVAMQSVTMSLKALQVTNAPHPGSVLGELRSGLFLGALSGAIVALIGLVWMGNSGIALSIAGALLFAGAIGGSFGFVIPRLVRRWNLDPSIASGPVALAATDIAALACYFALSSLVLL